jgi:protein SCO1/2
MRGWRLLVTLLLGSLVVSACGGPVELHGAVFQQPRQLDFRLTDSASGQPFRATDLEGKVALLFWGYTYCPDVCPTTLGEFKRVKAELGARAEDVRFVMITVDPERDTPDRLSRYVASFDPSFIGLWGDPAAIQQLAERYGIVAEKRAVADSSAGYLVDHTAMAFLVDKQGLLRAGYPLGVKVEDMAADVRALLAE